MNLQNHYLIWKFFGCLEYLSSSFFWLQILVIFFGPGVVKVNPVRDIVARIVNKRTYTGLILILQNNMTNQAQKSLDFLPFKPEIFQVCFLMSNGDFLLSIVTLDYMIKMSLGTPLVSFCLMYV